MQNYFKILFTREKEERNRIQTISELKREREKKLKDIYTYISKLFYFSSHKIHAHKRNSLKSSLQRWARFFHDSISSTTNDCKTGFKRLASFDPPPFSRRILPRTLYPAIHLATMFPSSGKRREIGNQKRRYYGVKHITECINVGGVS